MTSIHRTRRFAPHPAPTAAAIALALAGGNMAHAGDAGMRTPLRADPGQRIFAAWHPDLTRPAAAATVRTVLNCKDEGPGSLREAIGIAGDGDTIDLAHLSCGLITLTTGAIPVLLDNLDVTGPGPELLTVQGGGSDRLFLHYGGGSFTLRGLSLRDGVDRSSGFHVAGGGCIASAGYLTLDHSTVSGCYAGGEGAYGGAIYAYALTMVSSTLAANTACGVLPGTGTAAFGGGAFIYSLDLTDSTVTGNRAVHQIDPPRSSYDIGGGLMTIRGGRIQGSTLDANYSFGRGGAVASFADLAIANSTISGNRAASEIGGGVFLRRPATLALGNSTVTANVAAVGGGGIELSLEGGEFESSIVAGNQADVAANVQAPAPATVTGADNLVGASGSEVTMPADTLDADPRLRPLAPNGGVTLTHALDPASPAIDAGNNLAAAPFDQRGPGFPRIYGAAPDIGAFEHSPQVAAAPAPVPAVASAVAGLLGLLLALFGGRRIGYRRRRAR
jgi:hypothetical protein